MSPITGSVQHRCTRLGIASLSYLWRRDQKELYTEMLSSGLVAIIIKVAVMGLSPRKHLGLTMEQLFPTVCKLNNEIGMNICGEGGEFESFTLDCPLFKKRIIIDESEVVIHSDDAFAEVGFLRLKAMHLEDKQMSLSLIKNCKEQTCYFCCDDIENVPEESTHEQATKVSSNTDQPELPIITFSCGFLECKGSNNKAALKTDGFMWISEVCAYASPGSSVEEVTATAMNKLAEEVCRLDASLEDVIIVNLFIKDMKHFGKVNSVYKKFFPLNPPARACVELDLNEDILLKMDCLVYNQPSAKDFDNDDFDCIPVREAMHVQSISYWAPANIGPYSQAVKAGALMFVSGNIGLWPASMKLVDGGVSTQAALSLRHVDRIVSAFSAHGNLRNTLSGVCYLTCAQHIPVARKAWSLATRAKRALDDDSSDDVDGLMAYIVVPNLPKEALVEWQVACSQNAPRTWKHYSSSLFQSGCTLDFKSVYETAGAISSCVVNCSIVSSEINLDDVMPSFIKELQRISIQNGFLSTHLLLLRIFYLKSALRRREVEMEVFLSRTLQDLLPSQVRISLLPVEGLGDNAVIMISCHFHK
ncbi:diphthine--ammonia ligase isoform X2 [Nematostella vectensis]|uniref:diphthine--ammonia ligase isoform X2 n=1 Tax=Nematostella vectensis TaxID=45351 RepID=UPI0020775CB8|nr:diphthine--ammonia ligase isoform X2 [Nematostella vectensis]